MKLFQPIMVIAAFVTIAGGILATISSFANNSKDVKLEAFISFNDYEINPVFREKFNELVEKLAGQFALNEKISDYNLLRKNGFIEVSITNKGVLPSINTIIDIPNDGVAIVITPNGKKTLTDYKSKIELGDLRPNNTIHLKLWTKHSVHEFSFKEFNLTHDSGKGKVVWTKKVTGFSKYVSEIWPYALIWLVVLLILLILWGISIYPRRKNPIAASAVAYEKIKN